MTAREILANWLNNGEKINDVLKELRKVILDEIDYKCLKNGKYYEGYGDAIKDCRAAVRRVLK